VHGERHRLIDAKPLARLGDELDPGENLLCRLVAKSFERRDAAVIAGLSQ